MVHRVWAEADYAVSQALPGDEFGEDELLADILEAFEEELTTEELLESAVSAVVGAVDKMISRGAVRPLGGRTPARFLVAVGRGDGGGAG